MCKQEQLLQYLDKKKEEQISAVLNGEKLDMCITALEKQIPSKPRIVKLQTMTCYLCACDNTLKVVQHFPNEFIQGNEPNYCNYCGRKLDWSEVE